MERSAWPQQLDWVRRHTPRTQQALARMKPRPQASLSLCFHLDLKMVPVIEAIAERVQLTVIPCSPRTTDAAGLAYLETQAKLTVASLDTLPCELGPDHYLCDLGGELICAYLDSATPPRAALEGTTSGVSLISSAMKGRAPSFPIFDWNDAPLKREIHNEKMVGASLWQTFGEVTRLSLHGYKVGVLGFGAVGRGIARKARQQGASVSVYDPSPQAAVLASFEGFEAPGRSELLSWADIVVTSTGVQAALQGSDLAILKDGAFLLNAGHCASEISEEIRMHPSRREVLEHVEQLETAKGSAYLLAGGGMFNLGAGFGDSINGFDLTSAQLVAALEYLLESGASAEPGWQHLPTDFHGFA